MDPAVLEGRVYRALKDGDLAEVQRAMAAGYTLRKHDYEEAMYGGHRSLVELGDV